MRHASPYREALVLAVFVCGLSAFGAPVPEPSPDIELLGIDQFRGSAAAAAAWKALGAFDDQGAIDAKRTTQPAAVVSFGGRRVLELTCNFSSTDIPRAVWDRHVEQDL